MATDEGKIIADFIAANLETILQIGKQCFGAIDGKVQTKLKTAYSSYLTHTRAKYSKSKSFFIRTEAIDLYDYYVPTGIHNENNSIPDPSFNNCTASKRLVITGTGGSGKTILIKHLFLDCIAAKSYTPILIELRDLNDGDSRLGNIIEATLQTYKFDVTGNYYELAKKSGHLCFFLDGYDEVPPSTRKSLLKDIKALSSSNPNCPIVISSRPDDTFHGLDEFDVYQITPLSLSTATQLISKLPFDGNIKSKFIKDLRSGLFDKHESFLSNPLLLSIMLLTYSENAEIPTKLSVFYNQAYEALFQRHDANKAGYRRHRLTNLDIQDFSRVFSLFALQTYEKRQFKMPRIDALVYIERAAKLLKFDIKPEDYLTDLMSAACLLLEDGLEIAFSHRSFQEYFVALQINSASPDIQEKLIHRYWKNVSSDNVIHLLLEINPDLVERVLLVPKLEALFRRLGVKSAVGITHSAKYFKESYSGISVTKEGVLATIRNQEDRASTLVHMAVSHCKSYKYPSNEYYKQHRENMYAKYGEGANDEDYVTKNMTYKTPILHDILMSKGGFSLAYLRAAYAAFIELQNKHSRRSETLDELLGIER